MEYQEFTIAIYLNLNDIDDPELTDGASLYNLMFGECQNLFGDFLLSVERRIK